MDGGRKQEQTEMVRDGEAERVLKRTRGLMNPASHDTAAFSTKLKVHQHTHHTLTHTQKSNQTTTDKVTNNWRSNEC